MKGPFKFRFPYLHPTYFKHTDICRGTYTSLNLDTSDLGHGSWFFNDKPPAEPIILGDRKEQILLNIKAVSNVETVF